MLRRALIAGTAALALLAGHAKAESPETQETFEREILTESDNGLPISVDVTVYRDRSPENSFLDQEYVMQLVSDFYKIHANIDLNITYSDKPFRLSQLDDYPCEFQVVFCPTDLYADVSVEEDRRTSKSFNLEFDEEESREGANYSSGVAFVPSRTAFVQTSHSCRESEMDADAETMAARIVVHELGHTLGLWHAGWYGEHWINDLRDVYYGLPPTRNCGTYLELPNESPVIDGTADNFMAALYTGNSNTKAILGVGMGDFQSRVIRSYVDGGFVSQEMENAGRNMENILKSIATSAE